MPSAPATRKAGARRNHSEMDREKALFCHINAETHRQVKDLEIAWMADRVIVTGRSRSYYVKQLATQAVFAAAPEAKLDNEIVVVAS